MDCIHTFYFLTVSFPLFFPTNPSFLSSAHHFYSLNNVRHHYIHQSLSSHVLPLGKIYKERTHTMFPLFVNTTLCILIHFFWLLPITLLIVITPIKTFISIVVNQMLYRHITFHHRAALFILTTTYHISRSCTSQHFADSLLNHLFNILSRASVVSTLHNLFLSCCYGLPSLNIFHVSNKLPIFSFLLSHIFLLTSLPCYLSVSPSVFSFLHLSLPCS